MDMNQPHILALAAETIFLFKEHVPFKYKNEISAI
jgi:hypothetical protein